jgi:hypothetical protein
MIKRLAGRVFRKTDSRCGITLRVAIDKEGWLFGGSQTSGQINGSGGFANPALLVCTSDDSSQMSPHAKLNKRFVHLQVVSRRMRILCISFERFVSGLSRFKPIVGVSTFDWLIFPESLFHVKQTDTSPFESILTAKYLFHVKPERALDGFR